MSIIIIIHYIIVYQNYISFSRAVKLLLLLLLFCCCCQGNNRNKLVLLICVAIINSGCRIEKYIIMIQKISFKVIYTRVYVYRSGQHNKM